MAAYLLEAVALFIAATGKVFPVALSFLGSDTLAAQTKGQAVLVPASHHVFGISMVWLLIVLLAASAVTHFLMASYLREFYEKNLAKRLTPIRWVGYGVGSGLMFVAAGLLLGVQDLAALVMLFTLAFGLHGLYAVSENARQKSPQTGTVTYWVGTVMGVIAWLVLGLYVLGSQVYGVALDAWVWIIFLLMAAHVVAVAASFCLHLRGTGKWSDVVYGDRVFLIGNFLGQSALVWLIFAGSLRP